MTELLRCWDSLLQRKAMGYCANAPPSDDARNLLEAGIERAMSEYRRLGAIWKAC